MVLVEESGVKWVIRRFYRWRRNVLAAKPSYPQTLIADYTPKPPICQTLYAKNPYKFCTKIYKKCTKLQQKI
jgi:hypothetical protein